MRGARTSCMNVVFLHCGYNNSVIRTRSKILETELCVCACLHAFDLGNSGLGLEQMRGTVQAPLVVMTHQA